MSEKNFYEHLDYKAIAHAHNLRLSTGRRLKLYVRTLKVKRENIRRQ